MTTNDNFSVFLTHLRTFHDHVTTFVMSGEDLLTTLPTLGEDLLMTDDPDNNSDNLLTTVMTTGYYLVKPHGYDTNNL
jgi:hypothetical protein